MDGECRKACDILEKFLKENLCVKTDGKTILKAFWGWNYQLRTWSSERLLWTQ